MNAEVRLRRLASPQPEPADLDAVRGLLREYQAGIGISLDFQDFEGELASLPGDYIAPRGAIVIAESDGQMLGSVALRPLQWPEIGEIKRLYVRPQGRGLGLGRRLARAIMTVAGEAGYTRLRLDTLPTMSAALHVYDALGFRDIPPYRHNPVAGARFLECRLPRKPAVDGTQGDPIA